MSAVKIYLSISFAIACLFTNAKAESDNNSTADSDKPKVVSINPPADSKMALMSEIKITFDQPMMPDEFNVVDASMDKNNNWSNVGIISQFCSYDANSNTFTLLLALPGNWNGQIKLCEFKNIDGVEANDVIVDYHTLRDSFSKDLMERFEKQRQSAELLQLLKKIKDARASIFSLSEKISRTYDFGRKNKIETIIIKMNKGGRIFADMNSAFEIPWIIGCDGNQCWHYYATKENEEHLVKENLKDINDLNISICDFLGLNKGNIDDIIRAKNIEYGGTFFEDGHPFYIIRLWEASISSALYTSCNINEWLIDGKNYMPVQQNILFTKGEYIYKYSYDSINMPIPDSDFSPDSITRVPGISEPLGEGYDKRYITIYDGTSNGYPRIGWGKQGPKGKSGSGMN